MAWATKNLGQADVVLLYLSKSANSWVSSSPKTSRRSWRVVSKTAVSVWSKLPTTLSDHCRRNCRLNSPRKLPSSKNSLVARIDSNFRVNFAACSGNARNSSHRLAISSSFCFAFRCASQASACSLSNVLIAALILRNAYTNLSKPVRCESRNWPTRD